MQLPATVSIQIVPLTRGYTIVAGQTSAYGCSNTADVLAIIAELLQGNDDSLAKPSYWPTAEEQGFQPPTAPVPPIPLFPQAPSPEQPTSGENNPLHQRNNLLNLCDAWASGRITDEQFNEYLDMACPDISLEEAMLTRDSFAERDDGKSQLPADDEGSIVLHD